MIRPNRELIRLCESWVVTVMMSILHEELIQCSEETRPDTRLPKSRAGGEVPR